MDKTIVVAAGLLIIVVANYSPGEERTLSDADAADLAGAISQEAAAFRVPGADSGGAMPERAMQEYIDKVMLLASELEEEIRAGTERRVTRDIYQRLEGARLKAMELVIYHGVELDAADSLALEQAVSELAGYYAK